jgi:putative membrane protein
MKALVLHGFCWSSGSTPPKQIRCSDISLLGAGMKTFLTVGKVLTALFWGVVLANLLQPFAQPFALLLNAAGAFILLVHALELWLFNKRIAACAKPVQERVKVMLFGVFQLLGMPAERTFQALEQPQKEMQLEAENA